jgi:hypothetical protein
MQAAATKTLTLCRLANQGCCCIPGTLFRRHVSSMTVRPATSALDSFDRISVDVFRNEAFVPERPYFLPGRQPHEYPAIVKWFDGGGGTTEDNRGVDGGQGSKRLDATYLEPHSMSCFLDYELTINNETKPGIERFLQWSPGEWDRSRGLLQKILAMAIDERQSQGHGFVRFQAPLGLLLHGDAFNYGLGSTSRPSTPLTSLYIAQNSISDLPALLQEDLPVPDLVRRTGHGDIYGSSIWLGLEPTYTPLHRDPNHNIFVQLCGRKTVRLLAPAVGERLYRAVRIAAGQHGGHGRVRHDDMMQEPERSILMGAVWENKSIIVCDRLDDLRADMDFIEADVDAGDALYIPLGWWHSIRSWHDDGRINGSGNWWFR